MTSPKVDTVLYGIALMFLFSFVVIASFAFYYYELYKRCLYDPTFPCWADWKCTGSGGTPEYVWSTHFTAYYSKCLLSGAGGGTACNYAAPASLLGDSNLGDAEYAPGCNLLDYNAETNNYVSSHQDDLGYPNNADSGGKFGSVYPCIDSATNCNKQIDHQNLCSDGPPPVTAPAS